ncbi:MAG: hypothetical protein M3458_00010 [Acidobacteriota bacterium]|nr:hypothetical protein [Acidobacteriota bacterium]
MTSADILSRLRRFLLVFSVLLFGGTVVELSLVNHTEDAVQLIPFVLCGLGSVATLVVLLRPQRTTVLGMRICMGLVVGGSLFGIYEHLESNVEFQREINPRQSTGDMILSALAGANPLLAPGMLAVAGVLALVVTYHHPALVDGDEEQHG